DSTHFPVPVRKHDLFASDERPLELLVPNLVTESARDHRAILMLGNLNPDRRSHLAQQRPIATVLISRPLRLQRTQNNLERLGKLLRCLERKDEHVTRGSQFADPENSLICHYRLPFRFVSPSNPL